jgi:hypothetical protein
MRRRSGAGGEPIKGRRPKTPEPKRRIAPKAPAARSNSAAGREETEVARLTRELSEERKQRTAISEVLHLLSGSHGDLNRLFDTILTNATKLCQANFGALFLCEADAFRIVAQHNAPPAYAELRQREPLTRGRPLLRAAETKQLVHIADLREYVASNPADKDLAAFAKLSGATAVRIPPSSTDAEGRRSSWGNSYLPSGGTNFQRPGNRASQELPLLLKRSSPTSSQAPKAFGMRKSSTATTSVIRIRRAAET